MPTTTIPDLDPLMPMVCQCREPDPVRLGLWDCYECRLCGRLIIHRDEIDELERRRARRRHPSANLRLIR